MDAMIHIENLTKSYGTTPAVRGISFDVGKGQVVGFLGPNGAGKSTTMKVLTGFLEASSGVVQVKGIDVSKNPVEAKKHIGYLPENNPLYEEMMVEEYLEYVAHMRGIPKDRTTKAIAAAVERCGLGDKRGKDIGELSKGYRQRVGLAQAILHEPDILVLDEPTTGLDPNQVIEIRNLIKELGTEKTILMSTHILPEVQHTCSRALIISDGVLKADGPPSTLSSDGTTVTLTLRARGDTKGDAVMQLLRGVAGVSDVTATATTERDALAFTISSKGDVDPREALFDAVVEKKLVLLALERRAVSLEETFRKLTTSEVATSASPGPSLKAIQ
ncbi:MAG: ATP-binding cassette domain-containing protein [Deltaproteobacteria bacterium]|nr:ATP-binding cassette domain-containing protein [Deltaproteobacteria bacterium]